MMTGRTPEPKSRDRGVGTYARGTVPSPSRRIRARYYRHAHVEHAEGVILDFKLAGIYGRCLSSLRRAACCVAYLAEFVNIVIRERARQGLVKVTIPNAPPRDRRSRRQGLNHIGGLVAQPPRRIPVHDRDGADGFALSQQADHKARYFHFCGYCCRAVG